jgi:opacity protein-like surface antigen
MRASLMMAVVFCFAAANAYADDAFDNRRDKSPNPLADSYTETYVAVFAGMNFAQPLSNISGSVGSSSGSTNDVPMKSSLVYGGKVGLFSADAPFIGLELEAFTSTPQTKQSTHSSFVVPGAQVRVTTTALNVILRWPGERFQPYIGGGPAVFFMDASNSLGSVSDTKLGASGLAGLKVFLTKNWGLYGEYKYNHATFRDSTSSPFGQVQGNVTYDAHLAVAGIAYHFSP